VALEIPATLDFGDSLVTGRYQRRYLVSREKPVLAVDFEGSGPDRPFAGSSPHSHERQAAKGALTDTQAVPVSTPASLEGKVLMFPDRSREERFHLAQLRSPSIWREGTEEHTAVLFFQDAIVEQRQHAAVMQ